MVRLLTDENFNRKILRGVVRCLPELDCVVMQFRLRGQNLLPASVILVIRGQKKKRSRPVTDLEREHFEASNESCALVSRREPAG